MFYLAWWQAFVLIKAAMPFNFSSSEYLSHHRTRKNRVSPVSRASPAHMNSPLLMEYFLTWQFQFRRLELRAIYTVVCHLPVAHGSQIPARFHFQMMLDLPKVALFPAIFYQSHQQWACVYWKHSFDRKCLWHEILAIYLLIALANIVLNNNITSLIFLTLFLLEIFNFIRYENN